MGIFEFLKFKRKNSADDAANIPDEEYQLPTLTRLSIIMTDEIKRRREDEMLRKKYGIVMEKEGEFI